MQRGKTYSINEAMQILLDGGVGVMPTDTVYGVVAVATNDVAVARMYALKKRNHKPGTVIAATIGQLVALGVDQKAVDKVAHFWPGPLSAVLPANDSTIQLRQGVVGLAVRVVADPFIRNILLQTGPLLTSSANQPGMPGATTIAEAQEYFHDTVDFYVDSGNLTDRAPSTLIRITEKNDIEIIRQGAVTV